MTASARFRRIALAGCILAGAAPPAMAVEPDAAGDLDLVQRQLDASQARQTAITARREAIMRESAAISQKLIGVAEKMQARESDIAAAEARLARLDSDRIKIKADLGKRRVAISRLLAGLQRIEQNPPPALMVEPRDVLSALRGAMLFGTIVPELKHDAANLAEQLGRLESLRLETRLEQDRVKDYVARLESSRSEMTDLQARKAVLMAETEQQLTAERTRSRELAAKAKDLKQLLDSLAAERKAGRGQGPCRSRQGPPRGGSQGPHPASSLSPTRGGGSQFPAQGHILKAYGATDGFGGKTRGVFVATRAERAGRHPGRRRCRVCRPVPFLRPTLDLEHRGRVSCALGRHGRDHRRCRASSCRAGEPVGVMGMSAAPGTLTGDQVQDGKPVLYIEFRKKAKRSIHHPGGSAVLHKPRDKRREHEDWFNWSGCGGCGFGHHRCGMPSTGPPQRRMPIPTSS